MPVIHINRKDDKYYLVESTTKKGNPKYYFSKSPKRKMPDRIPDGYEIYENPNGQVFLRRVLPQLITNTEINIIKNAIEKKAGVKDYKTDIREATLTIHLPDQDREELENLGSLVEMNSALKEMLLKNRTYTPMMRFELIDESNRIFLVERYQYRGAGGWMYLDSGENLQSLSDKYCQHLGKDSFFELL